MYNMCEYSVCVSKNRSTTLVRALVYSAKQTKTPSLFVSYQSHWCFVVLKNKTTSVTLIKNTKHVHFLY